MKFNDFPILNETQYKLLQEQYSLQMSYSRKSIINKICCELNECINQTLTNLTKYNTKIINCLNSAKLILEKQLNNLSTLLNASYTKSRVKEFNFFTFLKKITNTLIFLNDWYNHEDKEYYKSIASKSINELLALFQNTFSILENSTVHFFKHM